VPHRIQFAAGAESDLEWLRATERRLLLKAIRLHLTNDAALSSRRRKRLSDNPLAPWELRVGNHRAFYEVGADATVSVLAIGIKQHNDLWIRGRRVELRHENQLSATAESRAG
jgi:mRNA-degrading endonuclease RelE of RelBE toxin-antitoxin system